MDRSRTASAPDVEPEGVREGCVFCVQRHVAMHGNATLTSMPVLAYDDEGSDEAGSSADRLSAAMDLAEDDDGGSGHTDTGMLGGVDTEQGMTRAASVRMLGEQTERQLGRAGAARTHLHRTAARSLPSISVAEDTSSAQGQKGSAAAAEVRAEEAGAGAGDRQPRSRQTALVRQRRQLGDAASNGVKHVCASCKADMAEAKKALRVWRKDGHVGRALSSDALMPTTAGGRGGREPAAQRVRSCLRSRFAHSDPAGLHGGHRHVAFSNVLVHGIGRTHAPKEYDRSAADVSLTRDDCVRIHDELRYYKLFEMKVHPLAVGATHFFKVPQ